MFTFIRPIALAAAVAGLMALPAAADTIYFSSESSDSTPVENLDGRIVWSFNAGTNQLTLDIFNDTAAPNAYTLSVLQFNTSSDVDGLSVASHTRFDTSNVAYAPNSGLNPTVGGGNGSGGFGTFDWSVDFGSGNDGPLAGEHLQIVFNVTADGGATLDMSDFFDSPAVRGQEETGVAVMHWTRGPSGDSAWGIPGDEPVVPEPATVVLLGLGVAGIAARRFQNKA